MDKEVILEFIHEIRERRRRADLLNNQHRNSEARSCLVEAEGIEDAVCEVAPKSNEKFSEESFRLACNSPTYAYADNR